MSSLYDQFFSETNINHIYNILSDIIVKEYSYNIKNDLRNMDIFKNKMNKVFTDTQQIDLNEINKELLTGMINHFQQELLQQQKQQQQQQQHNIEQQQQQSSKPENTEDLMDEYNKFMSQRNTEINYENKEQKIEPKMQLKIEPKIKTIHSIGKIEGGGECYGHSLIINPWGKILADRGTSSGFINVNINLEEVNMARVRIPSLSNEKPFGF